MMSHSASWPAKCIRADPMRLPSQARRTQRLLGPCAAFLAACHGIPSQSAGVGAPARAVLSTDTAASHIADARCDHELACGAVGAGRAFATREECASELLRSAQADLAANHCTAGIAARLLDDCAAKLRVESCHPLSTLTRMYACRPAGLCLQTTTEFSSSDVYGE